MHVVFVIPRFYPYRGGYENSMLAIGRCLLGRGHHVSVFTTIADDLESLWLPGHKTFPAEDFVLDGISVRRFPICYDRLRRRATRFAGLLPYWRWKAQFWTPGFRVPGLDNALCNIDADVFHVGPLPYNNLMYAGLRAAEHRRVPVIATPCAHLGEAKSDDVVRHYLQPHQIALLEHCDQVLCMTEVEREQLEQKGVPSDKLTTIGLGIDVQLATGGNPERIREAYNIDGPIVLHLGVKAYEKGSITLIEAMKTMWARGSKAWLVMAGPSLSAFDEYLASQTQPLPRLVNLPAFDDSDKRDLLAAATVVAQPSRVESLGLVLLEAWANAKPVVAADIEVSRELVETSGAGIVAPFGDSAALAVEIQKLLDDPELRREMGLRGQKTALAYDGRNLSVRNAEMFERVATGDRH
ncbi:MAG TPA: glycosyltransferase family 4 protein [Terriglobales bacterium]